jgi:hypothetical protein
MASADRDRKKEEILPWLANETLTEAEAREIRAHAESSPDAARELAFLRGLRTAIKSQPAARGPGELGWRRLQSQIGRERAAAARPSRWHKLSAIAAALVILVQAGVIVEQWRRGQVIVAGPTDGAAVVLQVQFAPTASEAAIRDLLQKVDGTMIGGPGALGIYRVQLEAAAGDTAAIAQALATLRQRGDVVLQAIEE